MRAELKKIIKEHSKKENISLLKTELANLREENNLLKEKIKVYEIPILPTYEIKPEHQTNDDEAVALTLLSDIHIEHKITYEQTNNLNKYNLNIAEKRLEKYFINLVKRIKKNRRDIKIDELIIGMLGDMIHGFIHEEYLRTNYLTPNEAMLFAIQQIERGLIYLQNNIDLKRITIVCCVGNHSRTTNKIYTDEEALHSYEWTLYNILKRLFTNFNWIINNSYYNYLKVYDKTILFMHGHEIKYQGGIGGIYVPLQRARLRINQMKKADLHCLGHFHTTDFFRNTGILLNGSVCGADAYSIRKGFEPEPPMQQFLLIDKKRGFTINEPILLQE